MKGKRLLLPLLAVFAAGILFHSFLNWEGIQSTPLYCRLQIRRELTRAAGLLETAEAGVDSAEQCLIGEGLACLDSDPVYPEYLANPQSLLSFWETVSRGQDARTSVLRVDAEGTLRHLLFLRQGDTTRFLVTRQTDTGSWETTVLPIFDMELTDHGVFYYRCYPAGDPHYIDYAQIRLSPADRDCWDLTRRYILPVGYQMVNLFLCDWQEGQWGNLSFSDLLEFLYGKYEGNWLEWEQYPGSTSCVWIPAALFEETVLPYFRIRVEELRELCRYDPLREAYPWKPVHGDELTPWKYPMCQPEVTSWQKNSDGTLTMNVEVRSAEHKTSCLFAHTLTVRPLEKGFQYVANQVTFTGQWGLPPSKSRFALAEGKHTES